MFHHGECYLFNFFNKLRKPKKPKIEIRHRTRLKGWIKCECVSHDCPKLSRWEDRLCIECWKKNHL